MPLETIVNNVRLRALVFIAVLFFLFSNPACSHAEITEDAITATFLCNVLGYVEWIGKSPNKHTLCMASGEDMKNALRNHIDTRGLGQKIVLRSLDTSRDTSGCNAVYIDESSNTKGISYIIRNARERQVLTIGNGTDFIKLGGLIQINFENRRLILSLNTKASNDYRIKISSRLISLAKHVR